MRVSWGTGEVNEDWSGLTWTFEMISYLSHKD